MRQDQRYKVREPDKCPDADQSVYPKNSRVLHLYPLLLSPHCIAEPTARCAALGRQGKLSGCTLCCKGGTTGFPSAAISHPLPRRALSGL